MKNGIMRIALTVASICFMSPAHTRMGHAIPKPTELKQYGANNPKQLVVYFTGFGELRFLSAGTRAKHLPSWSLCSPHAPGALWGIFPFELFPCRLSTEHQLGGAYETDYYYQALRHALTLYPEVEDIIIWAHSRGTVCAVRMLCDQLRTDVVLRNKVKGIILETPPADLHDACGGWVKNLLWLYQVKEGNQPIDLIAQHEPIDIPLLIVGVQRDSIIPVCSVRRLYQACATHGYDARLVICKQQYCTGVMNHVRGWLKAKCPGLHEFIQYCTDYSAFN